MPESDAALHKQQPIRTVKTEGANTTSTSLIISAGERGISVSVVSSVHTSRSARSSSTLCSIRHFSRAEWEAGPLECIESELQLLIAPSLGIH